MREILIQIAGIALLVGSCVVPPWDMPADAVRNEPESVVYAEAEEVIEPEEIAEESPEEELEYLGTFEMTAYEWTGNPCANGNYPEVGYTVACNSLPLGILLMIAGLFVIAYTQGTYMAAQLGCGPRDTLLVGLKKRLKRVPIGAVSIGLLSLATFIGWLLGGPVGLGTIISALCSGPILQFSLGTLHFDAAAVKHQNLRDSLKVLFRSA